MSAFLLALAMTAQGELWTVWPAAPTVGDTVRLERVFPAPAGVVGRARPLDRSELIETLRAPEIAPAAGGLMLRYALAMFVPGRHALPMPALELIHPDGSVELVLGDTALVEVVAVVPDTARAPIPRASRAPFARQPRRAERLVAAVSVAGLLLLGWALARRRRAVPPPIPVPEQATAPPPPLMRWLGAGERRAVAALAGDRLRGRVQALVPEASRGLGTDEWLALVGQARPDWPVHELEELLGALDRARFAPLAADDLAELVDRTDVVLEQLRGGPGAQ